MSRHKTSEEEDNFLQKIELVANNLSNGVDDLKNFVSEYKRSVRTMAKEAANISTLEKDTQNE